MNSFQGETLSWHVRRRRDRADCSIARPAMKSARATLAELEQFVAALAIACKAMPTR